MIGKLRIKNYAIIDELEIEFGKGFNVFTGETGAGKSIIIGALSLLLGEKGDPDMIRSGADEAEVEGVFEKGDETLTIKRILSRKGKSTVLINGKKSSLRELKEKGKYLFDIHGQHEHQLLLSEDTHLDFLDAYGELFPLRERVGEKVREVKNLKERIENLKEKVRLLEEKEELYRFQVDEIEKANLTPGEDEELEREKEKLENLERIREKVSLALEEIYERDGSTLEVLGRTIKELEDVPVDEELREIKNRMEEALSILEDLQSPLAGYLSSLDTDPARLDEVMERLELIERLKKKYGSTIEEILAYKEKVKNEVFNKEEIEEEIKKLEKELRDKERELEELAEELSQKRKKVKEKLERSIEEELKGLGMRAEFEIEMKNQPIDERGKDTARFLISTNPGEPLKPLRKVASGGELSRIMLAIKTILSGIDRVLGVVFDEIDAGIGGRIGEAVGRRMKRIGRERQVICITHLPQIAALGDHHFVVYKKEEKGRVVTRIKKLEGDERIREIARMLTGEKITESAIEHAKTLLRGSGI